MNRGECNRWIRRQIFPDEEDGIERAHRLVLCSITSSKKLGDEILTIKIPKRGPNDEWIQSKIEEIESAAKSDAAGLAVPMQSYAIHAYISEDPEARPRSRFSFREVGFTGEEEEGEIASEPPTKTGLFSQLMRHNENIHRVTLDAVKSSQSYLQHSVSQMGEALQKMVDDRFQTMDMIEKIRSEAAEREITIKREQMSDERKEKMFSQFMALLPVAVHKLTGKTVPGSETVSSTEAMINSLIETLRPEQLNELTRILSPDQQILIYSIIEARKKVEERNGAVNPQ